MRMRLRLIAAAMAAALLCAAGARAETPSIDKLRRATAQHAKATDGLSCKVRIQDLAGSLEGLLKIKGPKLMLDAERRDTRSLMLGQEQMISDGRIVYVLAIPRGKTVPNVLMMDIARMNAVVEKQEMDRQIARPDFCGNPLTALLDLNDAYVVDVVGEKMFGDRLLITVQATRKPIVERKPVWCAAEKVTMNVDPNNGFAYYVGKFDKDGKRIWEQFVLQIIPGARIPDKTFEYTPPAQARVEDCAKILEEMSAEKEGAKP